MKIGFCYDHPEEEPKKKTVEDLAAEYESEETIDALRRSLSKMGRVIDLPWHANLFEDLKRTEPDLVFNICESKGSRNRESYVPNLCEILGIPYTGSDGLALGLSLDKGLSKHLARSLGINTPRFLLAKDPDALEEVDQQLRFPLFVKPNNEGSSMGVRKDSLIEDSESLSLKVKTLIEEYGEPALIEEFLPGREFAVALLEGEEIEVFPLAEILVRGGDFPFYPYEFKEAHEKTIRCPAQLDSQLKEEMIQASIDIFEGIGARDLARVDFKLDEEGRPAFIEINPLPGLSPFYSIYPFQAEKGGMEHEGIVERLVRRAADRGNQI